MAWYRLPWTRRFNGLWDLYVSSAYDMRTAPDRSSGDGFNTKHFHGVDKVNQPGIYERLPSGIPSFFTLISLADASASGRHVSRASSSTQNCQIHLIAKRTSPQL